MNKTKHTHIPELRFPEFKNDGDWEEKTLGDICNVTNGNANAQDHKENGKYPLFDRSEVIKASDIFIFDCEAVIIPGEGMRFTPKYYKGKFNLHQRAYALKDFHCNGKLVYYSMCHRSHVISQRAVQSTVLSLRLPILQQFPIDIPSNPKEQQKIAACLSSLDELIEGHSQKLELLEEHKKGLLQNLFPQKDRKQPAYRFPEFKNDGDWEEKTLGEMGNIINGLTYSTKDTREKGLLVLRSSNIKNNTIDYNDCVFVRSDMKGANIAKPEDIIICIRNGSDRLIGKSAMIPNNIPLATHGAFMTMFRAKQPKFTFQLLQTEYYNRQVKADLGATINSINVKNLIKYKFYVPTIEEQQKIAACLSSLDELLKEQKQKIEQLKQHKKGLMQKLFVQ